MKQKHMDTILSYMTNHHGMITFEQVKQFNIPTVYLKRLIDAKKIMKVNRGVYMLPHMIEDELYSYAQRYQRIIYSGETAMFLNGMLNHSLRKIEANVPQSYNAHRIVDIVIYRVNDLKYSLGKVMVHTEFGNLVPTYNKERVICDLFVKHQLDHQAFNYAIKNALKTIDYEKLYDYAIKLNVYEKLKLLLELRNDD